MMTEAQIAARAAKMADQFWAEVEEHLAWQITQCRADMPTQRRMPDQPHPADDTIRLNDIYTSSSMLEEDLHYTTG